MTGNKFFSKTDVNMGRQPEIDLSKAVVIFFLATIHVYVECSTENQLWGGLPYFFDSILGGPWAAPMFMFSMGIGLAYTRKNSGKDLVRRSLNVACIATLLNVCRFLIPSLVGYAITGDKKMYLELLPYKFFGSDVLQFAAIGMLFMGILKLLKLTPWKIWFVSLAMQLISIPLNNTYFKSVPLNIFLGHFIGIDDGSGLEIVMSEYPLLVWFMMYATGYIFGLYLKRVKDKDTFYKWITLPLLIIPIIIYVIEYQMRFGMMGGPGANVFYHFNTLDLLLCVCTEIGMFGLYYFIVKHLPEKAMRVISSISKNITIVYFIQWVLVWWTANVVIYIACGSKYLTSLQSLILGLSLSVLSVVLAEVWVRFRNEKKHL